jgi:hypothetical protein
LQEKAYSNTAERIFPVTGEDAQDMTAVLMAEARQKLATAQAKQHSQQLLQQQQQKAAQQSTSAGQQGGSSSSSTGRVALKVGANSVYSRFCSGACISSSFVLVQDTAVTRSLLLSGKMLIHLIVGGSCLSTLSRGC